MSTFQVSHPERSCPSTGIINTSQRSFSKIEVSIKYLVFINQITLIPIGDVVMLLDVESHSNRLLACRTASQDLNNKSHSTLRFGGLCAEMVTKQLLCPETQIY
jgi:hypothetical protein